MTSTSVLGRRQRSVQLKATRPNSNVAFIKYLKSQGLCMVERRGRLNPNNGVHKRLHTLAS